MTKGRWDKATLRTELRLLRKAVSSHEGRAAALALVETLARVPIPAGAEVAGYVAAGSEIDPLPALERLVERGYTLSLPVVVACGAPLIFRRWSPGAPLAPGDYGIMVPFDDCDLVKPDVLLVPLLGFDRQGGRLGQGGGFYDRTVPVLRRENRRLLTIGLAFSVQEVDSVPCITTDAPLDWIVTAQDAIKVG